LSQPKESYRAAKSASHQRSGAGFLLAVDLVHWRPSPPFAVPAVLPLPTLSAATLRLSTALSNLTLAHAQSTHRINEISAEVGGLDDQERELRKEVERVETKREWAEGFRAWCETLGEFLEVKFPELEAVERENLELMQERHGMVSRRRMEDDADDVALCLGVPTEVDVATLQPYVAPIPPASADEEESLSRLLNNLTLPPTANIRTSRRTTRLARLASSTTSPASTMTEPAESPLDQGYLTDAALPQSDESDYILARAALDARRMAVFDDVKAVEMKDPEAPGGLLERFDQWRTREGGEEYRMAWGGEALVTALEFWARWEVAGWDPLKASAPSGRKDRWWSTTADLPCPFSSPLPTAVARDARPLSLLHGPLRLLAAQAPAAGRRFGRRDG
jgi:GC-rich sequence DNA-binding factor